MQVNSTLLYKFKTKTLSNHWLLQSDIFSHILFNLYWAENFWFSAWIAWKTTYIFVRKGGLFWWKCYCPVFWYSVMWAASHKKVPNVLSRCHTKRRMGTCGRAHPSLLVWHQLFRFFLFLLLVWHWLRTLGSFLRDAAHVTVHGMRQICTVAQGCGKT